MAEAPGGAPRQQQAPDSWERDGDGALVGPGDGMSVLLGVGVGQEWGGAQRELVDACRVPFWGGLQAKPSLPAHQKSPEGSTPAFPLAASLPDLECLISGSYRGIGLLSVHTLCGGCFSLLCCTPLPTRAPGPCQLQAPTNVPLSTLLATSRCAFRERLLSRECVLHGEPWARLPPPEASWLGAQIQDSPQRVRSHAAPPVPG